MNSSDKDVAAYLDRQAAKDRTRYVPRHPEGSQPGEWNAADVILWLLCWPWALMRLIGRHRGWTRTKQNLAGIGALFALFLVGVIIGIATAPSESMSTREQVREANRQSMCDYYQYGQDTGLDMGPAPSYC